MIFPRQRKSLVSFSIPLRGRQECVILYYSNLLCILLLQKKTILQKKKLSLIHFLFHSKLILIVDAIKIYNTKRNIFTFFTMFFPMFHLYLCGLFSIIYLSTCYVLCFWSIKLLSKWLFGATYNVTIT